ncbi:MULTISPECIES: PEP-CTERM sorting domain-containing protein [unclassified Janthinobacterium]|uniref:PEP-CTERM sorting domain-containing protein n=1 Tax=unclassified Janthinobacterium TaxID=2610881 RepID=UPI00160A041E|nr:MULTISPECIES: PEP-CTERM sorting domain-containing protein [unclassified Janthinobacterium]MBB5607638.1 hypothetical protein [Janthinobacterium sp. S3T4]MBB5612660.1 hypothetical protein [Janthinobacterium sp. S3M3]
MKMPQSACMALLALSASSWGATTAGDTVIIDDNINFDNNLVWATPDLPYARLLANSKVATSFTLGRASHARHGAIGGPALAAMPLKPLAAPVSAVPEANMYAMLLVGLGLLALSVHGEKQEKFDA